MKVFFLFYFFAGEIPQELGNLMELERLILRDNVLLTGQIPSLLFNISSLWLINLSNNSLTGDLPHNMCSHHHHPSVLEWLMLSFNQLTGTIPYNLWQCRELTIVSLSYNQFRGRIPRNIGNLTMVKALYIGGNNIIGRYLLNQTTILSRILFFVVDSIKYASQFICR